MALISERTLSEACVFRAHVSAADLGAHTFRGAIKAVFLSEELNVLCNPGVAHGAYSAGITLVLQNVQHNAAKLLFQ